VLAIQNIFSIQFQRVGFCLKIPVKIQVRKIKTFLNHLQVKLKCRSESDLFPALENSTAQASARAETNENDSETPHDLIHESVGEVCDSDLFFDFDIGSPEPEAEVNIALDHVINDADDGMLRPSLRQVVVHFTNKICGKI
jgi:hypothetical protein